MDEISMKAVRDSISKAFDTSPKLEKIYKKVRDGTATYEDAHKFAITLADLMIDQLGVYADEFNGDTFSGYLIEELLTKHGRLTSAVCDSVQKTLNEASGLGINPVVPSLDVDRISGIVTAMNDVEDSSQVYAAVKEPFKTCALSRVDAWAETNAGFQRRLGLSPIIVRKFEGAHYDSKSKKMRICKYCADLAGTYDYDYRPDDIFKRHLGCRCTVVMYPMHSSKGHITALAKGEKDTNGELWNTGMTFSNSRQAERRRIQKQYGKEEARRILNEEWKGGRNGQAERHFK